jgi:hypothetical protein
MYTQYVKRDRSNILLTCGHCTYYTCHVIALHGKIDERVDGPFFYKCCQFCIKKDMKGKVSPEIFAIQAYRQWIPIAYMPVGIHSYKFSYSTLVTYSMYYLQIKSKFDLFIFQLNCSVLILVIKGSHSVAYSYTLNILLQALLLTFRALLDKT